MSQRELEDTVRDALRRLFNDEPSRPPSLAELGIEPGTAGASSAPHDIDADPANRPRRRARNWLAAASAAAVVVVAAAFIVAVAGRHGAASHHGSAANPVPSSAPSDSLPSNDRWIVPPPSCPATSSDVSDTLTISVTDHFAQSCYYAPANTPLVFEFSYSGQPLQGGGARRVDLFLTSVDEPPCVHPSDTPAGMLDCSSARALYHSGLFVVGQDSTRLSVPALPAGSYAIQGFGFSPRAIATIVVG